MGFPILAIGMGWMNYPKSSIHAPLWVIGVCGGLFAACGLWLMSHGAKGLRRLWNMSHGKQQLPDSPWLWDYPWQASGMTDNKFKESLSSLVALAVFGAFLAPFNWIAFVSDSGGLFWQVLTGLFDVIILLGVGGYLLKNMGQYFTFGNGRVSFQTFPFFLGQKISLTIERLPEDLTTVQLHLRCIEEAYEIRKRGRKRESLWCVIKSITTPRRSGETSSTKLDNFGAHGACQMTNTSPAPQANAPPNFGNSKSKANAPAWTIRADFYCPFIRDLSRGP